MAELMRVGIVGGGAVTQVAHLPALRKLKGVEVVAVCDADLPKAQALAARFGIRDAYDDIEDLLEHAPVDAVAVCTPNHLHEAHAIAALTAGKHVLVEKPVALTVAGVQRVFKVAEKKGRSCLVGMSHRYRPDAQLIRGFVQSGELGRLESLQGSWHVFRPNRGALGWRQRRDLAGGGAMLDLGLTILDLGLWLAGFPAPRRVSAAFDRPARERAVENAGSAFVVCDDGPSLFVDVTWHHMGEGERFGVGVRGSAGAASLNPLSVWKELHGAPVDVSPHSAQGRESAFAASFRAQWAHFLACARGEASAPDPAEQVMLHRVMEAIYRSADDGRDVTL
ncbi:MAG: Gfo/Idh/MocA family oxidoreductase [Gemmatimonadales bacterium]|nr:Gfo/Idh/MocA family oxidoreductase [Gemmatimonadales bacterium]